VRQQAETLREEVDNFLSAARNATQNRRSYQRVPGMGLVANVRWEGPDAGSRRMEVIDISIGGAALKGPVRLAAGTEVTVEIAAIEGALKGRSARAMDDAIGLAFRQDPAMQTLVAQAIALAEARAGAKAA
jgi:hypothetical protein